MDIRIGHGHDPLPPQPDPGAGLGPLPDLTDHAAGDGGDPHLPAEYSRGKRYGNRGIHVHALPFKAGLFRYCYLKEQIPGLRAAGSRSALSLQADALSGFNARGDMHLQGLDPSVLSLQADHLIAAEGRFIEADGHLCAQVRSPLPAAGKAVIKASVSPVLSGKAAETAAFSAEHVSEDIPEQIVHISAFKMELPVAAVSVCAAEAAICSEASARAEAALAEAAEALKTMIASCSVRAAPASLGSLGSLGASVEGRVAEPVVKLLLLRIAEHLIGLHRFLEHLLRMGISRIRIGMVFFRQFSVCFFDRRAVRIPVNAQHLVIISLCCHDALTPFSEKSVSGRVFL